jgi:hypothetical protein
VQGAELNLDPETYCYCYGPLAVNPDAVVDPNRVGVENVTVSFTVAKQRACSEVWRWLLLDTSTS